MSSQHRITVRFSDGVELEFAANERQPVLSSALEAGVNLLYQCRAGSCSSCICRVAEGDLTMSRSTSIALLPGEVREGKILVCLATAHSDAVLEFSYESALLDRDGTRGLEAEVTAVEQVCESVTALTVEISPDEDEEGYPSFEPGMYYMLQIPETDQRRAYSVAAVASELPEMRFLIRHVTDGAMTRYVTESCGVGDRIQIEGPFGEFFLREGEYPMILIAGGTGLAPILSILDTVRERRRNRKRILLCFGVNRLEDLFFEDELELRRQMMPQLEIRVALVAPDPRWAGNVGVVTSLLKDGDVTDDCKAYVCGPPPMVEAACQKLVSFGLPEAAIFYERFAPSAELSG